MVGRINIANIKGPKGDKGDPGTQGPVGPQGIPGPKGDSAGGLDAAALKDVYVPRKTDAHASFAGKPDGPLTALDSGQNVETFGNAPLSIRNERLVHDPYANTNSGGYVQTDIGERVGAIGGTFRLSETGTIALVVPKASWKEGSFGPAGVHFSLTRANWYFGVWRGDGQDIIDSGPISLPADTDLDCDIVLDEERAYIMLPDGNVVTVSDPRISTDVGELVIHELYEGDGRVDASSSFSEIRADSVNSSPIAPAKLLQLLSAAQTAMSSAVSPPDFSTTITGDAELGLQQMRLTTRVPPSGKLMARLDIYLDLPEDDIVIAYAYFAPFSGSGSKSMPGMSLTQSACRQRVSASTVFTDLPPGKAGLIVWQAFSVRGVPATFSSGEAAGPAVISVIPLT